MAAVVENDAILTLNPIPQPGLELIHDIAGRSLVVKQTPNLGVLEADQDQCIPHSIQIEIDARQVDTGYLVFADADQQRPLLRQCIG